MLNGIYDDLQSQIDTIAELLRTLDAFMPASIYDIIDGTHIPTTTIEGSADELLSDVLVDLEHLVECYKELEEVAEDEDLEHISNYAQDRVLAISKQIWMLKATLEV